MSRPVVIYARYSTLLQDSRSIDDQERRCRVYAAAHDMHVVGVYADAAESGSHIERASMQRMLADAKKRKFEVVLVDDLSRLSRDLGNTWNVVFGDLADRDIGVVDVTSGMASTDPNARITFAALGMVNDQFLQSVRKQTHRGLEGRALAGFWAGGRCFGYATVQEENPPDPEHPRKRPVIDETQAAVVRRVFGLFASGHGLKQIASTLNDEGITAPNDGGRGNKIGKGWGHTTIRAMLLNERYIGRFVWNQHKWLRSSGKKNHRRIKRPESEWIRKEHPELAIIDRELWDAVQARFRRYTKGGPGRPRGTCTRPSLISGLMRCGLCGGSMTLVGAKTKNGVTYSRYGCTAHWNRGAAICKNKQTISENKITRALLAALQETLAHPDVVRHFVDQASKKIAAMSKTASGAGDDVDRRLRECERRIANLTDGMAKMGWSDALAARLKEEEAQLGRLKAERAKTQPETARPIPHPAVIARDFKNVMGILKADATRGRELLARFVSPLVMTPQPGNDESPNRWKATGALDLSFFLGAQGAGVQESGVARVGFEPTTLGL
jgi:site-specific DNA recombinase